MAAAARAESLGATLHRYACVTAIEPDDAGVTLRTAHGEHRADHVVLAPGPWALGVP